MVVPSAKTDFVGDFRRKTYHLHFTFTCAGMYTLHISTCRSVPGTINASPAIKP